MPVVLIAVATVGTIVGVTLTAGVVVFLASQADKYERRYNR